MNAHEWSTRIQSLRWKLTYRAWCEALGIARDDDWAQDKWDAWIKLGASLVALGDLLDQLLDREEAPA